MSKRIIVAIDGPAGAGKSTIARAIADRLGFVYIDSGAMYRAIALWALRRGIGPDDMHRLEQLAAEADIAFTPGMNTVLLNGEDVTEAIRTPEVSAASSKVSAVPAVRRALVEKQRQLSAGASVVMEGRDIGSVVFPDAQVKIFLDADPSIRADRRVLQLASKGATVTRESTVIEIGERDSRDRSRTEAPLVQAPDAVYVDTTGLNVDEVQELILKLVRDRTANGKDYSR
jgi:cytidylate kinase